MVSALRSKLAPHLVPARPVTVEHFLNVTNTPELFALRYEGRRALFGLQWICVPLFSLHFFISFLLQSEEQLLPPRRWSLAHSCRILESRRYTHFSNVLQLLLWCDVATFYLIAGRVFELEVDVRDQACLRTIATLNKCTALEYHANDRIRLVRTVHNYAIVASLHLVAVRMLTYALQMCCFPQHTEQLAYLARRMQALEKDRVALATALDLLDGTHAEQPADAVVKAEAVGASASISESVSGEASVVEADQMALLQACMFPLYE